jgi:ribonucleoside-diphosphate reductase alpha chain
MDALTDQVRKRQSRKRGKSRKLVKKSPAAPCRERLPDTRRSITHKFSVSGHEGYITVGLYPDGRPGELFVTMAKEGSTIGGLMDCFGTAVSMSLQYGVPLERYVNKFSYTRFEPMGFTKNPDIRMAKSLVDYIFRWLAMTFLPGYDEAIKRLPAIAQSPSYCGIGDGDSKPELAAKAERTPTSVQATLKKSESATVHPRMLDDGPTNEQRDAFGTQQNSGVATVSSTRSGQHSITTSNLDTSGSGPQDLAPSVDRQSVFLQTDSTLCDVCGLLAPRVGRCFLCFNCGNNMGCS